MTNTTSQPTSAAARIESLDVIRGFALLGILLLNILTFAMPVHFYVSPLDALTSQIDRIVWFIIDVSAEGAMRCLFSMLFGAGVALFLEGRAASLHFKRTFWLLIFGVLDFLLLLWLGDVLLVYALAGFLLYTARNTKPSRLLITSGVLLLLMSLQYAGMNFGLAAMQEATQGFAHIAEEDWNAEQQELAAGWQEMRDMTDPDSDALAAEIARRTDSYASAFDYALENFIGAVTFLIPFILFCQT